jgi:hypothetical protein
MNFQSIAVLFILFQMGWRRLDEGGFGNRLAGGTSPLRCESLKAERLRCKQETPLVVA